MQERKLPLKYSELTDSRRAALEEGMDRLALRGAEAAIKSFFEKPGLGYNFPSPGTISLVALLLAFGIVLPPTWLLGLHTFDYWAVPSAADLQVPAISVPLASPTPLLIALSLPPPSLLVDCRWFEGYIHESIALFWPCLLSGRGSRAKGAVLRWPACSDQGSKSAGTGGARAQGPGERHRWDLLHRLYVSCCCVQGAQCLW